LEHAKGFGRFVAPIALLLQRLHHDPVQERASRIPPVSSGNLDSLDLASFSIIIEVATERVLMVDEGKTSATDGLITINGGPDAATVVPKIAKRAAEQIP
jgi:hypothetical protein